MRFAWDKQGNGTVFESTFEQALTDKNFHCLFLLSCEKNGFISYE